MLCSGPVRAETLASVLGVLPTQCVRFDAAKWGVWLGRLGVQPSREGDVLVVRVERLLLVLEAAFERERLEDEAAEVFERELARTGDEAVARMAKCTYMVVRSQEDLRVPRKAQQ